MRYGIALIASTFVNPNRTTYSRDVSKKVSEFLTQKRALPSDSLEQFRQYLSNKPGSPRYTPLRRALAKGQPKPVEHQDLLLSDSRLTSSVGALTQDYFDDALSLAHMLKLVRKDQNLLLARGRLSLDTGWKIDQPFRLSAMDSLYLGLWMLDVDCDWLWAFLLQIPADRNFEITVENRVELLLESWKLMLSARQIRSGYPQNAKTRTRLTELIRITERNVSEKLNLGQPWSWFLVPRLELLVDAGIFAKSERHGLTGYRLTAVGRKMRSACNPQETGATLVRDYFRCHDLGDRPGAEKIDWETIENKLNMVARQLKTSVGFFPIFEAASAICVLQFLESKSKSEPIWELESVRRTLWRESKSASPSVRLAINRHGHIYAFKPLEKT